MDITPIVPADRQLVKAYGDGGFRIAGTAYTGSVLIFPDRTQPWPVSDVDGITAESLKPFVDAQTRPQILVVGTGPKMAFIPPALRAYCREYGIVLEVMDTGAACRTYNVLLTEDRSVAAALIAVD